MARSERLTTPRAFLRSGQSWPDGDLVSDAPVGIHVVRAISGALRRHMKSAGLSGRAVEAATGVGRRTVDRILNGDVIPDVATVAHLEAGLGVRLWPSNYPRTL